MEYSTAANDKGSPRIANIEKNHFMVVEEPSAETDPT